MVFRESEKRELKRSVVDDVKKEIVAFANSDGGRIYVGVGDDGSIIGLDDADKSSLQISNMIRDSIKPDLTMFVRFETLDIEGRQVLSIDIQRGTQRPYYLAKKGLRSEGVYIRQGYSSAPASDSAIRKMIKETDGDCFEEMRSLNQELTFEAVAKEFSLRGLEFGCAQRQSLKLTNHEGLYTNLGLLLSDQCVHSIKTAVFQGTDQNIFKDRQEFSGSLFRQMNDVYGYIDRYNQTRATFDVLLRVDTRDYPEVAIREALLNVLVHRDYAFSASALISIYSDRMEFISVGGLVAGIELDDVLLGLSVCRNQGLANIFFRLQLIEAYGTGIKKIMTAYKSVERKPVIEVTANAFKITLPNVNAVHEAEAATDSFSIQNRAEDMIMVHAKERGYILRSEVEDILGISSSSALRLLKKMVERGKLDSMGTGRGRKYIAHEK